MAALAPLAAPLEGVQEPSMSIEALEDEEVMSDADEMDESSSHCTRKFFIERDEIVKLLSELAGTTFASANSPIDSDFARKHKTITSIVWILAV